MSKENYQYLEEGKIFLLYSIILLIISYISEYEKFFVMIAFISFIFSSYCVLKSKIF